MIEGHPASRCAGRFFNFLNELVFPLRFSQNEYNLLLDPT